MPWKSLRPNPGDGSTSKRHSTLFTSSDVRHSEQNPRPSPTRSPQARRQSDNGPRPYVEISHHQAPVIGAAGPYGQQLNTAKDAVPDTTPPSSTESIQPARRNRFSMLRFRHASDPQLSASYARSAHSSPSAPPLPPPPTIITTAPTSNNLGKAAKRKNKIKFPLVTKVSTEDLTQGTAQRNSSGSGKTVPSLTSSLSSNMLNSSLGTSRFSHEDAGRLSTSSFRSTGRGVPDDFHHSFERDARISESSRSDRSSAERGPGSSGLKNEVTIPSHKMFRLPRLKRNRGPLFPLPVKLPPPDSADPQSASSKPKVSPAATPNTMDRRSADLRHPDDDRLSPLPSPSHSSVKLVSPKSGFTAPPLFRKDSTNSARSAKSASSGQGLQAIVHRGRSSTLESLTDQNDENHQHSPNLASSGRTSISTTGRKSFGDLFSLTQRLRQNSEPATGRSGYSSAGLPGTPTPDSKNGSFAISRDSVSFPPREDNDTPATYLERLQGSVHRGAIASILSKSDEDFYKVALRKYMRTFSFFGEPIDMAIRKLLMEVELPKETQQIDRVLQGFADRYHECNPGIFASTDQAYFIAFSILILHTDVFNKNNKRKMQKQDYVKNSRVDGVSADILECFYENILYTPFIHVEDELNLSSRNLAKPRKGLLKVASSDHLPRVSKEPVDPYALILENKLDTLRPNLKEVMDLDDPYSFAGIGEYTSIDRLHQIFSKSAILQIVSARSRPDAFMSPTSIDNPADSHPGLVDIKVAKVGLLWRKDPKKKRTRSPWQEWGALLTSSQLYFFKDINWAKSLLAQYENHQKKGRKGPVFFSPPLVEFKPDAIMSTADAVALIDSSYKKHKHAFLLVRHNGLEEVFLANNDTEMSDWMAKINYAATFRTCGVPVKGIGSGGNRYDGQHQRLNRMDSLASDHSSQTGEVSGSPAIPLNSHLADEMSTARVHLINQKIERAHDKISSCQKQLDDLLRNARHLQILTPITSRAREHVILAAGRMSARLKWVRYDIWRARCYRSVLSLDLGLDEKQNDHPSRHPSVAATSRTAPSISSQPSLPKLNSAPSLTASLQGTSIVGGSTSMDAAVSSTEAFPTAERSEAMPSFSEAPQSPDSSLAAKTSASSDSKEIASSPPNSGKRSTVERQSSLVSARSRPEPNNLGSPASKRAASSASNVDEGEELVLREAGLLGLEGPTSTPRIPESLAEGGVSRTSEDKKDTGGNELRGRSRRSLQRTLRDSHHGSHHHRSKKGRDSGSSIVPADEGQGPTESESLARKEASFSFHGKKASVINFGSEWQNMSAEERLKLRKPTPSENQEQSDKNAPSEPNDSVRSGSLNGRRPQSMRSASSATARSSRIPDNVSLASEIPEIPSLNVSDRERQNSAVSIGESIDSAISGPGPSVSEPPRRRSLSAENYSEQIAAPAKRGHSPHEQIVEA